MNKTAKLTIAGIIFGVVIIGGWFWLNFTYPSDSKIRKRIVGAWRFNPNSPKILEYKADGSYLVISPKGTNGGTWKIDNGYVFTTPSNAEPGEIYHDKIVRINR